MAGKRSIFEEVGETRKQAASPGGVSRDRGRGRRFLRVWLMTLFALVVVMIAVGGLTRLTDSGLSITEWAPVTGAVPPLSAEDWQAEFDAYREIPEYQLQNRGMSLEEFKFIYWWEWGHRQLGRFIGLVWAVGFVGLLATRMMPPGWTGRALLLGALGGAQGAIGWWMVSSGLTEGRLDVASYRLAVHLGLAFLILALIAWFVLRLGRDEADLMSARREGDRRLKGMATGVLHLSFAQILIGALVAGIDAGRNYPDWPLMAGGFTPPAMWALDPWWRNLFENDGTVQFIHRMAGYLLLAVAVAAWLAGRRSARTATRGAFHAMMAMMLLQIALGIVTVLYSAPWYFAIAHQFGAVVLIVLILRARFVSIYPLRQSVRGTA
ncbi:COX15/CtaA family protein [Roseibacterium sp. SDUM158017]|uniref:heme A synthase n=1 Tax=Roseicyclus salinarum TaxID=3036773 RepID=UPI002415371E|nr:heme A synthase [Roseibacterium sp. SDUM158017]MDG4648357.1 COX15/CtaA family protein [Roseibacterium sp. SDUM158017]